MTTQKAQRKIKSSTVAITVLSILLAIALVSTIVLAAFTANRQATTTIQFAGGLNLTLNAAYEEGEGDFTIGNTGSTTGDLTFTPVNQGNIASTIVMPTIEGRVSADAFLSYRVVVFYKDGSNDWTQATDTWASNVLTVNSDITVTVLPASNVSAHADNNGVYYYDIADNEPTNEQGELVADSSNYTDLITSITIAPAGGDANNMAGYQLAITIQFYAESVAGDGSQANVMGYSFPTVSAPGA